MRFADQQPETLESELIALLSAAVRNLISLRYFSHYHIHLRRGVAVPHSSRSKLLDIERLAADG